MVTSVIDVQSQSELRRRLYRLAWPAIIDNALYGGVFMIEIALIGRLGAESLTAAGISNALMQFVLVPIGALSVGGLALVARAFGRQDLADGQRITSQVLLLAMGLSLAFTVLILTSVEQVLQLVGAEPQVIAIGAPYARLVALFAVPHILMLSISNVVRGIGDTKSPMIASILMTVITGVVGYLLVFDVLGPTGLGLLAVAIASGLARVVASVYLVLVLMRSPLGSGLWRSGLVQPTATRRVIRTGGPAAIEQIAKAGGKLILDVGAIQLGTVAFAAYKVVGAPISITFLATMGMGMAAGTAVGQSLGANRPDLARRYAVAAVLGGLTLTVVPGIVILTMPAQLLAIFTTDLDVIRVGETPLRMLGIAVILNGVGNVLPGALRGAGDTKAMMVVGFLAIWVARLPVALLLGFGAGLGVLGLWMGHAAEIMVRSGGSYVRFRSGKWQSIDL